MRDAFNAASASNLLNAKYFITSTTTITGLLGSTASSLSQFETHVSRKWMPLKDCHLKRTLVGCCRLQLTPVMVRVTVHPTSVFSRRFHNSRRKSTVKYMCVSMAALEDTRGWRSPPVDFPRARSRGHAVSWAGFAEGEVSLALLFEPTLYSRTTPKSDR